MTWMEYNQDEPFCQFGFDLNILCPILMTEMLLFLIFIDSGTELNYGQGFDR